MRTDVLDHRACRLKRRILAMLLAALWLVAGAGRSDGAGFESFAAGGAASTAKVHHCKCGMGCKGRCCCEKKAKSLSSPSKPKTLEAGVSVVDNGPCMGAAPCGAELPGAPSVVSVLKSTAIHSQVSPHVEAPGSLLAIASTILHVSLVSSRLDDPPESAGRF